MIETTAFIEFTRANCLDLLESGTRGRVVFTHAAMPAVQPVSYILDDGEAVFRVTRGSPLATATHDAVVGFQVDHIDPDTGAGWSVLGVGQAYQVTDPGRRVAFTDRVHGWAPDSRAFIVAVPLQQLTGNRFSSATVDG
ncbi:pyridoxamine 5'-phosphate oxidase family protein [Pseudonocardia sp.]|jgi:nitroimidazol reductase NimA-like FMN-containing flavoprotein (pyridoxamine 5'-phosphate oxidase superfamily)|uniref:pyridoxamine 5'-phosphate oxidase family protein n=1 Tax=Pseudonocardia sp. TaxID=60912 RepID=UPI00261C7354|nr:pyridoxamine 5'-phosphate oxidase family protein [Pseudonocardia sp.]MCW2720916.1 hypothetical protein [Pseudonocardia sp.]MDT7618156.1 hypothetical protein [Pseudonocardiales bacterium]